MKHIQVRGWRAALATVLLVLMAMGQAAPAVAANAIETTYKAAGSFAVSTANVTDASGAVIYNLYYPSTLGAGGIQHPIITWGNGSNAAPSNYYGLLNHLASWGFVIVASTSPTTGKGDEMLAGVNYMLQQNDNAASVFYHKLDIAHVAAVGHSQGAGGAVNATTQSGGVITSTVTIALPNRTWVSAGDEYYPDQLTAPAFFLGGQWDIIIASPSTVTGFYNEVPGAAARAVLKGADHNTIQNGGGGFLGYINAWMMYTLRGDSAARAAFVGTPPEITGNSSWQTQATKSLP